MKNDALDRLTEGSREQVIISVEIQIKRNSQALTTQEADIKAVKNNNILKVDQRWLVSWGV